MDANGIILAGGVSGRKVNTAQGESVVYDVAVQLDDGSTPKFGTFEGEIAGLAKALEGQRASFRYEVKTSNKNGKTYTNYYLNVLAPEGQLPADDSAVPIAGGTDANGIPISSGSSGGGQRRSGGGKQFDPEVQRMIVKQNVFGTAHNFIASLYHGLGPDWREQAEAEAEALARNLYKTITKTFNAANPPATVEETVPIPAAPVPVVPTAVPAAVEAPIVPTATTPAEVAAGVAGVQVGAPAAPATPVAPSGADIAWD